MWNSERAATLFKGSRGCCADGTGFQELESQGQTCLSPFPSFLKLCCVSVDARSKNVTRCLSDCGIGIQSVSFHCVTSSCMVHLFFSFCGFYFLKPPFPIKVNGLSGRTWKGKEALLIGKNSRNNSYIQSKMVLRDSLISFSTGSCVQVMPRRNDETREPIICITPQDHPTCVG